MSETESDEDVKKAIALSLMSPEPKPQKSVLISLVSDDEDEDDDLDKPVTAKPISARASAGKKSPPPMDLMRENVTDSTKGLRMLHSAEAVTAPMTSGLLGLNRKQMEHERLARAARRKRAEQEEGDVSMTAVPSRKRKASTSPTSSQDQLRQIQDRSGDIRESLPKAKMEKEPRPLPDINSPRSEEGMLNPQRSDNKVFKNRNTQSHERMISSKTSHVSDVTTEARETLFVAKNAGALKSSSIQYLDGVVKKTWAFGYDRQGDDIKIEEVLQKNDLDLAVLSAFQLDADWVMSKLDAKTKVVWVLQAKDEAQKQNWASGAPKNFRFCFPPMSGNVNCMHSKLQLLAHPTHLRVVVPSANLTPYDWGETGVMENVCFIIDLPRLPDGQETDLKGLTQFAKELLLFLEAMGLDKGQINSMRKFDFSRTAHLAFVHSIGGSHTGTQLSTTGLCGLGKAIRDLGLSTEGALNIDFLAASIGSLNENFLKSMYLAAQGDDGLTGWCTNMPARGKGAETRERKISEELKSRCRIYFPSRESVEQSKGGIGAGGTICLQSKWYDGIAFPRFLMRDCKSQRDGLLMHSKMIFVRPEKDLRDSVAWAYVGSANLSESAWGRLVKGRGGTTKLNCRNWECGVVIPIPRSTPPAEEAGASDQVGMSVFKEHVPVPMIVPGEEYRARRPWFYNEQ